VRIVSRLRSTIEGVIARLTQEHIQPSDDIAQIICDPKIAKFACEAEADGT
jgi:hypothetical protein